MAVRRFLLPLLAALLAAVLPAAPAAAAGDPLRDRQWGLDTIRAEAAQARSTGVGAVVAVIDTGVAPEHPDLQGQVLGGRDLVDDDDDANDGNGHGTFVSGIVAAGTGNGIGIAGVAPRARILPVRVLADDGAGGFDDVSAGIDWAVARGADVINLSLGPNLGGGSTRFEEALERAVAAGVVVVAAAGNDTLPFCQQPSVAGVLCVGAVDRREQRSFFSSFGGANGIVAPGGSGLPLENEDVWSTCVRGEPNDTNAKCAAADYGEFAGTSFAAPHAAGVAALLASFGYRGEDAVNRILGTARDAGLPGNDPEYGHGILDAGAALAGLEPRPGSPAAEPAPPRPHVRTSRRIRRRTALRRGFRVVCRPVADGRCRVRGVHRGRRIAYGSARTEAGRSVAVIAKLNRRGRRLVRNRRSLRVELRIALPGSPSKARRVTVRG